MGGSASGTDDVLEDIAFLSRSASRVRILDVLATEAGTRGEIQERTGIARTTVDRVVNEFEERGWARRTADGGYTATPAGGRVATEFGTFVNSMEAIDTLGELVGWLPLDEVPIDLHHFRDVTVRQPDPANPLSTASRLTGFVRDASEFHCIVGLAPPVEFEKAMRDGAVDGDLRTEHVITDGEFQYLLERPERLPRWREYLAAGANVYRYDGAVPCNLFVFDGTVVVGNSQSEVGEPLVLIESENETVRSWALEVVDAYRGEAERLEPEAFVDRSEVRDSGSKDS